MYTQTARTEEKYKLKTRESQGRKILLYAIDIDGFEMKKIERVKKWEKRVKSIWQQQNQHQQPERVEATKKSQKCHTINVIGGTFYTFEQEERRNRRKNCVYFKTVARQRKISSFRK